MSNFLKTYGTEGPLGFPMLDKQATAIDALLKSLPKSEEFSYRKTVFVKAPTELNPGERSDVSWISTERPDRYNHVVFAKGMNDSQFALNPIVTLNHDYYSPPVGRSLWRKFVKDGDTRGIKAKTQYPPRPETWPDGEAWMSDKVFSLIQEGLLNGKSIGWLPIKAHYAEPKEFVKNEWPEGVLVIEEWLLVEYAVGTIPVNPDTVVEVVSKTLPMSQEVLSALFPTDLPSAPTLVRFTSLEEIQRAMEARIGIIDLKKITQGIIERMQGRI